MAHRDYLMNYHVGKKTTKNNTYGKIFLFIFLLIFLVLGVRKIFFQKSVLSANVTSPIAKDYSFDHLATNPRNSSGLENVVSNALQNSNGTYAVEIINLKTGEEYKRNENLVFESASLYKLWIMAIIYQKIEKGQLKLTQKLTDSVRDLNTKFDIDKELAEKTEGSVSMTVQDALTAMITKSDNYAALLLASNIGLSNIQNFLNMYGLSASKVGKNGVAPVTTASDTSQFLDKLYNGELANSENTKSMIALLQQQVLNEKIPKYLPDNLIIAHKTGELDDFSHDAGVVYAPNEDYIISIFSKTNDRIAANEVVAEISKEVYDYFEK